MPNSQQTTGPELLTSDHTTGPELPNSQLTTGLRLPTSYHTTGSELPTSQQTTEPDMLTSQQTIGHQLLIIPEEPVLPISQQTTGPELPTLDRTTGPLVPHPSKLLDQSCNPLSKLQGHQLLIAFYTTGLQLPPSISDKGSPPLSSDNRTCTQITPQIKPQDLGSQISSGLVTRDAHL